MKNTWNEWKYKQRSWKFVQKYFTKKKPKISNCWIKAKQYAIKTTPNKYRLIMKIKKKGIRKKH